MTRLASAISALAMLGVIALVIGFLVEESSAELEPKGCPTQGPTQVFTSRGDRVRIVIPRGWCATDHPSYPGFLVSMIHNQPPGQIQLTSEPFTRELYCSWPVSCRNLTTNTQKYACALREKLANLRMRVGPSQLGPKENELAGLPSVWFEYDDNKTFLRQAVAVTQDRALSLVLSAPTNDARTAHVRPFDTALRTLQTLTAGEAAAPTGSTDAAVVADDSLISDAVLAPTDASLSTPIVPRQSPIGPCPNESRR
jgi:hypothetical protein